MTKYILITCYDNNVTYISEYKYGYDYDDFYEEINKKYNLNIHEDNSDCIITNGLNIKIL